MHCVERGKDRRQLADALDHLLRRDASELSRRRPAWGVKISSLQHSIVCSPHGDWREARSGCEHGGEKDGTIHVCCSQLGCRIPALYMQMMRTEICSFGVKSIGRV